MSPEGDGIIIASPGETLAARAKATSSVSASSLLRGHYSNLRILIPHPMLFFAH